MTGSDQHPKHCHVHCNMISSMKAGLYTEGNLWMCCRVSITRSSPRVIVYHRLTHVTSPCRESASCTHISRLLHALVAMSLHQATYYFLLVSVECATQEKGKHSKVCRYFISKTWVCINSNLWVTLTHRPAEHRGIAPALLESFLATGVMECQYSWTKTQGYGRTKRRDVAVGKYEESQVPSRSELLERDAALKESLWLSWEKIRQSDRETIDQSQLSLRFSARHYWLTASVFGKVFQRLPSIPLGSLVKALLHPQQCTTKATEWGRQHEPIAVKAYVDHQISAGHTQLVAVKAGFMVCEEHPPFLGASPDTYIRTFTTRAQLSSLACWKSNVHKCTTLD